MKLARDVYQATEGFPRREVFGLISQLCRAAISVPSNIAEGQGRLSEKSFAVFLGQARGSLFELETQLELAESLGYHSRSQLQKLLDDSADIGRMLNGLLNTLRQP